MTVFSVHALLLVGKLLPQVRKLMLTHDCLVHPFKNYFVPDTDRALEKVLYKPKVVESFK